MDDVALATIQNETQRLICRLVESIPTDLASILKPIVSARSTPLRLDSPCAEDTTHNMGISLALDRNSASANPIPWAPAVLALCCRTYGAPVEYAIPVGACLNLLAIASSPLDSAQDGHENFADVLGVASSAFESELLRSKIRELKIALLSNVGTTLIGLAWRALFEYAPQYGVPSDTIVRIGQVLTGYWGQICTAQHLDLTLARTTKLTIDDYDTIIAGKAGLIGAAACEVAAVLAGAENTRTLWHSLGLERTVAQQLCDDYIDLQSDLAESQQLSHPILYGLGTADDHERGLLLSFLATIKADHQNTEKAVEQIVSMLNELGAPQYTIACIALHRMGALDALQTLNLPTKIQERLEQWVLQAAPIFHSGERAAA